MQSFRFICWAVRDLWYSDFCRLHNEIKEDETLFVFLTVLRNKIRKLQQLLVCPEITSWLF